MIATKFQRLSHFFQGQVTRKFYCPTSGYVKNQRCRPITRSRNGIVVMVIVTYLLTLHISIVDHRLKGADGLPWWSPSQILASNYCVCSVWVCVCVLIYLAFIIAVRLGNKEIFYHAVITADITGHS
jgi:hypothetical protein